jgi:dihydroorotase
MNPVKYLIKGAILPNGDQKDIAIQDGVITAVSQNLSGTSSSEQIVIDAKASRVLPGLVDLHTHLRQPGREDAETVLTGSRAGAKGGFTALSAMANTSPVADSAGVVEQVFRLGQEAGCLSYWSSYRRFVGAFFIRDRCHG